MTTVLEPFDRGLNAEGDPTVTRNIRTPGPIYFLEAARVLRTRGDRVGARWCLLRAREGRLNAEADRARMNRALKPYGSTWPKGLPPYGSTGPS